MITGRVQCFVVRETGREKVYLRRYHSNPDCGGGYCNAMVHIYDAFSVFSMKGFRKSVPMIPRDDERWPKTCDKCGYEFQDADNWQMFTDTICKADDGREWGMRDLPPGAMWYPSWMQGKDGYYKAGPDGFILQVILPDGKPWVIDATCNNCTRRGEDHSCWCRHGVPPNITVDKNCNTCTAGAGSILTDNYHGFLRNGWFEDA